MAKLGQVSREFDKVIKPGMGIKPVLYDARVALGLAVLREVNDMNGRQYRIRIRVSVDVLIDPREAEVGERVDAEELFKLPGVHSSARMIDVLSLENGDVHTFERIAIDFWVRTK